MSNPTPGVVFRVASAARVGGGHVSRCLAVARALGDAVPVLMALDPGAEAAAARCAEAGMDDYLTKPFSMRELMARVKAMLRRREMLLDEFSEGRAEVRDTVTDGELVVDVPGRVVSVGERIVRLKPREFDLLLFLMRHRGEVFSAASLIRRVWGHGHIADTSTVPVHVRGIRKKVEEDPARPQRIVTVRGAGYRYRG